jgi:hypothetical protein
MYVKVSSIRVSEYNTATISVKNNIIIFIYNSGLIIYVN